MHSCKRFMHAPFGHLHYPRSITNRLSKSSFKKYLLYSTFMISVNYYRKRICYSVLGNSNGASCIFSFKKKIAWHNSQKKLLFSSLYEHFHSLPLPVHPRSVWAPLRSPSPPASSVVFLFLTCIYYYCCCCCNALGPDCPPVQPRDLPAGMRLTPSERKQATFLRK